MKAGFAREKITPPLGTKMMGFGTRDREKGCQAVHDDLFARALWLRHEGEEVLILSFDICFFGREDADRLKGAIGRLVDLSPRQILLNTTHTHVGPAVGSWAYAGYDAADRLYLKRLETATLAAVRQAHGQMIEVALRVGEGTTSVPVSRRRPDGRGGVIWAPAPEALTYDWLPVCLLEDGEGCPVCLLFSVACHPSTAHGWEISADYPGVATACLDKHLGRTAAMFLQGTGGDAKARVIARQDHWASGSWEEVERQGRELADEVVGVLEGGLRPARPALRAHSVEAAWPLAAPPERGELSTLATSSETGDLRRLWAQRQLELLDRGETLPRAVPVSTHAVQLAEDVRIVGLEGEAVAGIGHIIRNFYDGGLTLPLGYTDGAQLYLPTESMLSEGGYEVESYYEYGMPAPLASGFEAVLLDSLRRLQEAGIE